MKSKLLAILCVLSLMGWSHAEEAVSGKVAAITVDETNTSHYTTRLVVQPAVAKIGETSYATLAEAIAAVQTGQTITLSQDATLASATEISGKALTIDLAEKTLTFSANITANLFSFTDGACVTFKNGTIDLSGVQTGANANFQVSDSAQMTFEKVNLIGENYKSAYAVLYADKTCTGDHHAIALKNCTVELKNELSKDGGFLKADNTAAKFLISGCTITLTNPVRGIILGDVTLENKSSLTITGAGTAETLDNGINSSNLRVTNSTISISNGSGRGLTLDGSNTVFIDADSSVTIAQMREGAVMFKDSITKGAKLTVEGTLTMDKAIVNKSTTIDTSLVVSGSEQIVNTSLVAQIGETLYTFDDAIAAANTAGASQAVTVKLLQNVTRTTDVGLGAAHPITLDLAGFTLDLGSAQLYTQNTGLVTLTGNGTVKNSNTEPNSNRAAVYVVEDSSLRLDGVTVEGTYGLYVNGTAEVLAAKVSATDVALAVNNSAQVTIGTAQGDNSAILFAGAGNSISTQAKAGESGMRVKIYGGTFKVTNPADWDYATIYWASHGALEVYGGSFENPGTGKAPALYQKNGSVTIAGGSFEGYDALKLGAETSDTTEVVLTVTDGCFHALNRAGLYYKTQASGYNCKQYEISISGGTFTSNVPASTITTSLNSSVIKPSVNFTGGLFTANVSAYCAAGYMASKTMVGGETLWAVQPAVAQIGGKLYTSLAEAVEAVPADGTEKTIVLLQSCTGSGIKVAANKNIVFDLNGNTYTVTDPAVGSSGTETNAFQLLRGATVTFRNGALESVATGVQILIQNYCNLTLDGVTLNAQRSTTIAYALSNNCGQVTVTGETKLYASTGKVAFDLYYWPAGNYSEGVSVTFDENFTGLVEGKIEYDHDNTVNDADCAEKAILTVAEGAQGLFNVTFSTSVTGANIQLKGGLYNEDPSTYCAEGYAAYGAGTAETALWAVLPAEGGAVAERTSGGTTTKYATLSAAIAAAQSGDTVTLLQDTQEEALEIGEGTELTIDLGGKTAMVTGKTFGTDSESGTSMAAALLNRGTLTLQNGTLKTPDGSTMTALCNTGTLTLLGAKSSTKLYITASQGKVLSSFGGTVSISSGGYANLTGCVAGTTAVIDLYGATLNLYGKVVNSCTTGGMGLALFPRGYTKGGKGSTLMMTGGTLSAYYNAISLNATMGGSSAKITGGTVESTGKGAAIYWPYEAALTIGTEGTTSGPEITGGAGILICGGSLTFYGGTITAEAGEFTATAKMLYPFRQYSGSIGLGDAITVVANRGTGYVSAPLDVRIINSSSSKINADNYAVRYLDCNQAKDGNGNPVEQLSQQVTVSISGGIFTRTSDAPAVTEGANPHVVDFQYAGNAKVLTGGTFYDESVPAEYCAEGYAAYCATTLIGKQWTVLGSDGADCIAKIGETKYVTLAAALYAVQSGETVTLLRDAPLTTMKLPADATAKTGVVLDLAQHSWYGISFGSELPDLGMTIKNGRMMFTYNPVINGVNVASTINLTLEQVEVTRLSGGTATYAINWKGPGKLTLGKGTEISVGTASGIYCYSGAEVAVASGSITGKVGINVGGTKLSDGSYDARGVKVQVDGTITATDIGLNVFGSITATEGAVPEIALGPTAQVTSGGVGIYAAGYAKWTVADGAQISGALSGIEIRAGELTVNGGTIKSLAKSYSVTANGSGTTTVGAGIAVAQHGTKLPLKVTITGGEISGPVALSEANPQGNEAAAINQVALAIQGGTFVAQSAAVVTEDCTGFVSGGNFSNAVPLAYCATGKVPKTLKAEDSGYQLNAPYTVVEPTSETFVAVKADGSAEVYESLATVPTDTQVYIAPGAETVTAVEKALASATATTGPADKPRPTTLKVKEVVEVLGGAFTVKQVADAEGQTTETKLVYHYNFGVAGLEVRKQPETDDGLALTVVAKLTEGELPANANRTLVGRTLQVVLTKGDGTEATYSVANPVFNEQGECRVAVPWEAMTHGTNAIRVKVVK